MIPKFRAWIKERQQMVDVGAIDFIHNTVGNADGQYCEWGFDEVILLQSTGLHDAKGAEIFEGDILKVCDDDGTHNEAVFREGQVLVMNVTYQDFDVSAVAWALDCYHGSDDDDNEYPVVVGNVHQNPELLEA